jgi:hypothetical protein
MTLEGKFDVALSPQKDEQAPVGRMLIDKTYHGKMKGIGTGQMISKRLENGTAAYFAIEEFVGKINEKSGSFTLLHNGFMNSDSQSLDIIILEGSGTGELATISGKMDITIEDGNHFYKVDYDL